MKRKAESSHRVMVTFANGQVDEYAELICAGPSTGAIARKSAARDLNDARVTAREKGVRIVAWTVTFFDYPR